MTAMTRHGYDAIVMISSTEIERMGKLVSLWGEWTKCQDNYDSQYDMSYHRK